MTPLVVENEPPVTFLRRKMTGGRFSMGVVIRRYTGFTFTIIHLNNNCKNLENVIYFQLTHKKQLFTACIENILDRDQ